MNRKALKTVFLDTVPVLTGYLFLGAGFGILLSEKTGYGIGWAIAMSVFSIGVGTVCYMLLVQLVF